MNRFVFTLAILALFSQVSFAKVHPDQGYNKQVPCPLQAKTGWFGSNKTFSPDRLLASAADSKKAPTSNSTK